MLRPEAWLLAGLYVLWAGWRASWPRRIGYAALAAVGPVVWVLDRLPRHRQADCTRFTGTTELADELGRNKGAGAVPAATWSFLIDLAKFPVVLGAHRRLLPRAGRSCRAGCIMPVVLFASGVATFALVGAGGLSVISRYLLVPSLMAMVLCGVAVGGWTMLRHGTWARRIWAGGALLLVLFGIAFTATRVSVAGSTPAQLPRRRARRVPGPHRRARLQGGLACGPVWTPNHKLVPDARWILDLPQDKVIARSSTRQVPDKGVVILVHGRQALFNQALVTEFDDPMDSLPPPASGASPSRVLRGVCPLLGRAQTPYARVRPRC